MNAVNLASVRQAMADLERVAREHPELLSHEPVEPMEWVETLRDRLVHCERCGHLYWESAAWCDWCHAK